MNKARTLSESPDRIFLTTNFKLESGERLQELKLAYVTLGELNNTGTNAILLTHGFTSSHRLAKKSTYEASEGGWNLLVGPGKPIDTDKYFVISSNMLGSSYGSSGPNTLNPSTNKPYGSDFPAISMRDIVAAQHELLKHLNVQKLTAVVGASFGGFQAFQWAIDYPDFVLGIVAAMSSLWHANDGETVKSLTAYLSHDPNWNDGDFYKNGGIEGTLKKYRIDTLRKYGRERTLKNKGLNESQIALELERLATPWARQFDANSLITLLRAAHSMSIAEQVSSIKSRVLYLLSTTDEVFPCSLAPKVMSILESAQVNAEYHELQSDKGHSASHEDAQKWAAVLERFLLNIERG